MREAEKQVREWFAAMGWTPFPFQEQAWEAWAEGKSGLLNAPTGSGKTYALLLPGLMEMMEAGTEGPSGLRLLWITPIRALSKEIRQAAERAEVGLGLSIRIKVRTGDTSTAERRQIRERPPEILITTPESLHVMLSNQGYASSFSNLSAVVVDEWHELLGSKRGVQMELALSRLRAIRPAFRCWGISATIGNLEQALEVLLGSHPTPHPPKLIRATIEKRLAITSLLPDKIDTYPWAGHLGIKLIDKVLPILNRSKTTLIFTNTRAQCEIWYQRLLEEAPDLAGVLAMHHGSISRELRDWVEQALHEGTLKAVVCTSSLDLGVDFRPVETIIQIGSPKGVARFVQRAGRSGHRPGAVSTIHFLPTHALELLEAEALRTAVETRRIETREPLVRSFDVLVQYLVTLACSDGFDEAQIYQEVRGTHCFQSVGHDEWLWILEFLTSGGALHVYDEYQKLGQDKQGLYRVMNQAIARRHKLSIGTIVSDGSLLVKYVSGKRLGSIEEWFIAQLKPGDVFWFAGRSLELVRIRDMTVQVRKSSSGKGKVPAWLGGRMPLSSQLSDELRRKVSALAAGDIGQSAELAALAPIAARQAALSVIPDEHTLLLEYFLDAEGYHLLVYPFEGRSVHEGLASIIAWRLSRIRAISFSIAMNDYGFELLSDSEIPIREALDADLFGSADLADHIRRSLNETELARRRFRDIASIAGLVFQGFPGQQKKDRHLQSSASLVFDVFAEYDAGNLLFMQAFEEVRYLQLEEVRLRGALERIAGQRVVLTSPGRSTPLSFPIIVDRLREGMSSEQLEVRIRRMIK